ncbi:MAG: hypothetical protein BWK80_41365 [Desulfobacteraceae bacterium IS3]|nr:MAG: hypothetical protein BWK80_41365 [Desulfobacteraceae bacterium IS3]
MMAVRIINYRSFLKIIRRLKFVKANFAVCFRKFLPSRRSALLLRQKMMSRQLFVPKPRLGNKKASESE